MTSLPLRHRKTSQKSFQFDSLPIKISGYTSATNNKQTFEHNTWFLTGVT